MLAARAAALALPLPVYVFCVLLYQCHKSQALFTSRCWKAMLCTRILPSEHIKSIRAQDADPRKDNNNFATLCQVQMVKARVQEVTGRQRVLAAAPMAVRGPVPLP